MTRFIPAAEYLAAQATPTHTEAVLAAARAQGEQIARKALAGVDVRNLPALDRAPCPFAWPCPFCGEEA